MIRHKILVSIFVFSGAVYAQVFIQLCDPCDLTPLITNQVMVGKKCSLLLTSDANDLWSGGLFLSGQDRQIGVLQGRDKDPNSRDWTAGPRAKVFAWNDSAISGFDFYNCEWSRQVGAWFLIDYRALQPGNCCIGYYDHGISWTQSDPNVLITIENIPNLDFYVDDVIDLKDFAVIAAHWLEEGCSDPTWCEQTDVDRDGVVGITDITLFAEYWLWGNPGWHPAQQPSSPAEPNIPPVEPPAEPNTPPAVPPAEPNIPPVEPPAEPPAEPNVVFKIIDANELQEITLNTGESICLYLTKQTFEEDVFVIYLEVNISDPNLGWIDNTEYDPNNPGSGTAQILASPRTTFFDYYGPGYTQFEGIQFIAASLGGAIQDGSLASFVYTATGPGDVILTLVNYDDFIPARLEQILIHQTNNNMLLLSASLSAVATEEIIVPDANELTEFLIDLWNTDETLRNSISETEWKVFIEDVKSSSE
jgi:hypothetical protein